MRRLPTLAAGAFAACILSAPGHAATPEEFFSGTTVRIIIGFSTGGTYGQYSQLAARHIRKHLPGNPTVIVQSMQGGGGVAALNYVANVAPKDGSVVITAPINVVQDGLMNPNAQYDPARWQWIGRMMELVQMGVVWDKAGVRTLDDAKTTAVSAGGIGATNPTTMNWRILNRMAGTKFNLVSGYKGLPDATLAWQRGEIDAVMMNWETAVQRFAPQIEAGEVRPLFSFTSGPSAEMKDLPALGEMGRDAVEQAFLQIYTVGPRIGRSLAVYEGVPADRLAAWRAAFDAMLKDPEFLAEIEKGKMRFDPLSGMEVADFVDKAARHDPETLNRVKELYESLARGDN